MRTPEGQSQRYQEQSDCEPAPGNLGGRPIRRLFGASRGVFLGETLPGRIEGGSGHGGGQSRWKILVLRATDVIATSEIARIIIATNITARVRVATIFIATALFATIFPGELGAVIVAAGGRTVAAKVAAPEVLFATVVIANNIVTNVAELGQNGLLLNLTLAQRGQVVRYGFFFVESDLAGVGAHETLVEDAAGELVKMFVFEGTQHAGADFCGVGDGIELDAALLALFAKFLSERTHGQLRRAGLVFRPHRHANNHRRRRGRTL
jgi:hypothetical protein